MLHVVTSIWWHRGSASGCPSRRAAVWRCSNVRFPDSTWRGGLMCLAAIWVSSAKCLFRSLGSVYLLFIF